MHNNQPFARLKHSVVAVSPWLLFAIFLTALDIHFISVKVSEIGIYVSSEASKSVVDGLPHWRIYQSRVLGPYAIHAISYLFDLPVTMAYLAFIASILFVTKLIIIRFGTSYVKNTSLTLLMLASTSLLFAMLLSNRWLYPWDIAGLLLSTLFVIMVLQNTCWLWFILLAVVSFLNRESGFFICVWLLVQGLTGYGKGTEHKQQSTAMLVAAVITAIVGLAWTDWLREQLMIRETGPELWNITPEGTSWFQWKLNDNLGMMLSSFTSDSLKLPIIQGFFYLCGVALTVAIGFRSYPVYTALCAAYFVNLVFIFLFGKVIESRVMIEIAPFFSIFLIYFFAGPGKNNLKPGEP